MRNHEIENRGFGFAGHDRVWPFTRVMYSISGYLFSDDKF